MNAGSVVLLGSGARSGSGLGPQLPTTVRSPLPPFPTPIDYASSLPFHPPSARDLNFYRGQFCGLRLPNAPAVPGSNGDNPSCVMACLLDNYPADIQKQFLAQYAADGYTHLQRSIFHALWYGSSLQQYLDLSKRARGDYGLYCDHWWLAGDDVCPGSRNQDVTWWKAQLDPLIGAVLKSGAIDHSCVGWQLNLYNEPGNQLIAIIKYVAEAVPREIPTWTHWANEAMAFWKKIGTNEDGSDIGEVWTDQYQTIEVHDRFTWWYAMQPYLTGGHHQGNTRMLIKEYQDRICDTLDYFGGRTDKGNMGRSQRHGQADFGMTVYECSGQDQFDDTPKNPYRISEDQGDLRSYLLMCTTSPWAHLAGYGNGGRLPSGEPF